MLLRAGAFLLGAIGASLIVGMLDDAFPWAWLPILFGVCVFGVVSTQKWFTKTSIAGPFCMSIASGTTLTYCLSTKPATGILGSKFPAIAISLCAVVFFVWVAIFLSRGFRDATLRPLASWLLIPIWAGCVVGYVSGGIGGGDHMVHWLMSVTSLTRAQADTIVHFFRKGIHVSAYGIVGMGLFRAGIAGRTSRPNALLFAMSTVLCIASFDELRQTTAPNRTGSAWDVALDMTGAFLFIAITAALLKPRKNSSAGPTIA